MQETDTIFHRWYAAHRAGQRSVLATIVATEGSSYRKPGARMLISEDGQMVGAVSGGCVEQAVARQARQVFASAQPEIMAYDGRYRLGCNGTLYIFLELVQPLEPESLWQSYQSTYEGRRSFTIATTYRGAVSEQGSILVFPSSAVYSLNGQLMSSRGRDVALSFMAQPVAPQPASVDQVFVERIHPSPQLFIIGSEQDAIALAQLSTSLGWSVKLMTHPLHPLTVRGLDTVNAEPETLLDQLTVDEQTAIVLMTHSYSRDLGYLLALCELKALTYLGILGPQQRRDSLLSEVLERTRTLPSWLDETLYAPAGIDLGAELPAEVALSILAEIKAVFAHRPVSSLRNKRVAIHASSTPPV